MKIKLKTILVSYLVSNLVALPHSFDEIDLDLYTTIDLKPKCVSVSFNYASGEGIKVLSIVQPYREKVEAYDAFGESYVYWNNKNRGPAVELRRGIYHAKAAYTLALSVAGTQHIGCKDVALGTLGAKAILCGGDGIVVGSPKMFQCLSDAWDEYWVDVGKCDDDYSERLDLAISSCDDSINSFIQAYGGCGDIEALVELWEEYWEKLVIM